MSSKPQIVILAGPTASGKTALACSLARALDAEVISADSQQCYRGLDAGTAKPTREEQEMARHHLLDIAWPEEQLDVAQFIARADEAIAEVLARGKRALVVGGTGLWIRGLVQGLVEAPGRDEDFRAKFRERLTREGLPAMFAELQTIDPDAAQRILPGDRVRIERALEVFAATGKTLSSLQREHRFSERRFRARVVLLDPPREQLWARIEARTKALFAIPEIPAPTAHVDANPSPSPLAKQLASPGLLDPPIVREARWLRSRAIEIPSAAKALGIIGYGEAAAAIDRSLAQDPSGATLSRDALEEACQLVCARTRQYAKRQRTWFKKDAKLLDEMGEPLLWPPRAIEDQTEAFAALCSALRGWYETPQ